MILTMLLLICAVSFAEAQPHNSCIPQKILEYDFDLVASWRSPANFTSTWSIGKLTYKDLSTIDHIYKYPINFRIGLSTIEDGRKYQFLQFSWLNESLHIFPFIYETIKLRPSFFSRTPKYIITARLNDSDARVKIEPIYEYAFHNLDYLMYNRFFDATPLSMFIGGGMSLGHYSKKCNVNVKGVVVVISLIEVGDISNTSLEPLFTVTDDKEYSNTERDDLRVVNVLTTAHLFHTGPYVIAKASLALGSFNAYLAYKCAPLINIEYRIHKCYENDENIPLFEKANDSPYNCVDEILQKPISKFHAYIIYLMNTFNPCITCLHDITYGISWDTALDDVSISLGCSSNWFILSIPSLCDRSTGSPSFIYTGYTISFGVSM